VLDADDDIVVVVGGSADVLDVLLVEPTLELDPLVESDSLSPTVPSDAASTGEPAHPTTDATTSAKIEW
jgi:hypothetical protein